MPKYYYVLKNLGEVEKAKNEFTPRESSFFDEREGIWLDSETNPDPLELLIRKEKEESGDI